LDDDAKKSRLTINSNNDMLLQRVIDLQELYDAQNELPKLMEKHIKMSKHCNVAKLSFSEDPER
jgi:hypothetical protein